MRYRATRTLVLAAALALTGAACGGDDGPSAEDVAAEAREQAGKAADEVGEAAGDAADKAGDVAADVADGDDDALSVEIVSPAEGASLAAGDVELKILVDGVTIMAADGDDSGRTGHFHLFIDRDPVAVGEVIPKTDGVVHSAANPVPVPDLSPGQHRLTVVVGDGNHVRIGEASDTVSITVT